MHAAKLRRVGRYLLHHQIGVGGMATVSLGRLVGETGFSRVVAVKQVHPHHANNPDVIATLLEEARLAALVRHPNVVQVLDVVSGEGSLALVMDLVVGDSLSGLLAKALRRERPLEPAIAVAVIVGMLEGLHAAHEAADASGVPLRLVHRDVSPQNVLVGVDGIVRVTDFGIAKALGRAQATTDQGIAKGKVQYMAPEQFAGKPLDRRSDVWAAAAVLWETLAGAPLFGDHLAAFRYHASREEPPLPPPRWTVAPELEAIVRRGLTRDPDGRYATARDMAIALEKVCAQAPPRKVGQWVRALARDVTSERAEQIRELQAVRPDAEALPVEPTAASMVSSTRSAGSASSRPSPRPRSRRAPFVAAAVLVAGGIVVVTSFLPRVSGRRGASAGPEDAARPTSTMLLLESHDASAAASLTAAPAPSAVADSLPAASASAEGDVKGARSTSLPTRTRHAPPRATARPPSSAPVDPGDMGSRK